MSVKTLRPVRPGLAAVALLGACCAGGTIAAGETPKAPARDAGKDLFTVFSAAGADKAPALTGDPGVATDARPGLYTVGDRKAAAFRLAFKPAQRYAAWFLDASSVPKAFSDPDLPPEPEQLSIVCRASKGCSLVVRLSDGDDVFESEKDVAGEEWNEVKLALSKDMKGWQPATRGDGKLARLRSIAIGLRERGAPAGFLELASVGLLPSVLEVEFKTRVPGNLFVTGEKPSGQLSVKKGGGDGLGARIWIEDAFGNRVREIPQVALGGKETEIALPEEYGYYNVRTRVSGYRSGGAAGYAVIPDNRVPGREPNSPFGVCCHWGDYWYKPPAGVVAKRAGIAWIRDGHHEDTAAPGGSYEAAKANGLCILSITGYCPKSEKDVLKPDGTYDFSGFLGRRSAYAKTAGDEVDFYDMTNEPVFQWSKVFGSPRWLEVFSGHLAPQYAAAVQKADPGSRILWEGYPDQMETFFKAGGGKSVFAISPHTYWFKSQPEDRDELNGGYAREIELMRKNGVNWPVWIGEMGCTTFQGDSQHFKSVTELEQAACLVRACCAHFAAGVEKIFWYDLVEWTLASWGGDPSNDATNCEYHFGIIRKDFTAKPAIAAYANLIAQVKGCRWLGRARVKGGDVFIYAFQRPGEAPGLVAWTRKGTAPLPVPAGAKVTDIFGKQSTWAGGDLTLGEVPVYLSGCAVDVEPVPTHAQLARHFDATDVKLGARYGARSPAVARDRHPRAETADTAPAAATAPALPPAARRTVKPAAAAEWGKDLFDQLSARIAQGKPPRVLVESMGQVVSITGITGTQLQVAIGGGSAAAVEWKWLTALDQLRLAQALLKQDDGETDPAGNARVAFFALAAGQEGVARPHLERSGPHAERVLAGFDAPAPATAAGGAR